jgi:GH24 family phage-related lysozyme (muramidase)
MHSVSLRGILFHGCREGAVLVPYSDGDYLSIGFGHNGPGVKADLKLSSLREAWDLLVLDIRKREPMLNKLLGDIGVLQHEYDALMSLMYQGGRDNLEAVLHWLAKGDRRGALHEWLDQDTNAKNKHLEGLEKRRVREMCIFEAEEYGDLSWVPLWVSGDPHDPKNPPVKYYLKPEDLPNVNL